MTKQTITNNLIRATRKGSERAWTDLLKQEETALKGIAQRYHEEKAPNLLIEEIETQVRLGFVAAVKKFPVTSNKRFRPFYEKIINQELDEHLDKATPDAPANNIAIDDLTPEELEHAMQFHQDHFGLDNDETFVLNLRCAYEKALHDEVHRSMEPEEAYVLEQIFLIEGEPKTLKETGKNIRQGVGAQRVGQIRDKALRKLTHPTRIRRSLRDLKDAFDIETWEAEKAMQLKPRLLMSKQEIKDGYNKFQALIKFYPFYPELESFDAGDMVRVLRKGGNIQTRVQEMQKIVEEKRHRKERQAELTPSL